MLTSIMKPPTNFDKFRIIPHKQQHLHTEFRTHQLLLQYHQFPSNWGKLGWIREKSSFQEKDLNVSSSAAL